MQMNASAAAITSLSRGVTLAGNLLMTSFRRGGHRACGQRAGIGSEVSIQKAHNA